MTATTPSTAALDAELNRTVLAGRILDAFDRFYADDVVMQENTAPAIAGKSANREREIKFVESIAQFHGAAILRSAVEGETSFSEWVMDVTFKGGARVKLEQVAVRTWHNGRITRERFYYNAGTA